MASSLLIALGGVEDFDDVITLSTQDIDTLYYYVKDEKEIINRNKYGNKYTTIQTSTKKTQFQKRLCVKLKCFVAYTVWKCQNGEPLSLDYSDLDERDFDHYRTLFESDGYTWLYKKDESLSLEYSDLDEHDLDHHHRKFGSDGYKHDTLISKTYDDYDNNVTYDSNGQDKSENF